MPFRMLTNTDVGRTTALDTPFAKWATTPAGQRPITQAQYDQLVALRTPWKQANTAAATALVAQTNATSRAEALGQSLERLISHFFQVFNLAVARGYYPASARAHYKLDVSRADVPLVLSQADRLTWAQNIVDGEAARQTAEGAAFKPMAMPAAAEVAAALTAYQTAHATASTAKTNYDLAQEAVEQQRPAVDALILDLWDTVEYFYRHDEPSSLRRKAREWGVVYMTRPGEPEEPTPPPTPPA